MAELRVVAVLDGTESEMQNEGNQYATEMVAPDEPSKIYVVATDDSGNVTQRASYLNVDMEWLPPKTNWTAEDYFNAIDYNRIIGNIRYLKVLADELFTSEREISRKAKKDYMSLIYAKEINEIEKDIDTLNNSTYLLNIGVRKTYKANGQTPDYNEYNRIEGACLRLYNELMCHKNNLSRMAFKLGNNMRFGGF